MKAAITTLEIALENLETNEPIHRKEGNVEQADAELRDLHEIRQAINILKLVEYCFGLEGRTRLGRLYDEVKLTGDSNHKWDFGLKEPKVGRCWTKADATELGAPIDP